MWLIQLLAEWSWGIQGWLMTPQAINAVFVLLNLAAALGAEARRVALVSALLYLALVAM